MGKSMKMVMFGDSLTEGYGLSNDEALPAVMQRLLEGNGQQIKVLNYGISGETATDGLLRMKDVLREKPDCVAIEFGANDFFTDESVEKTLYAMDAMLTILIANKISVLIVGIKAFDDFPEIYRLRFNSIFPDLAEKHQLLLYPDILAPYYGTQELMLMDGTHPNAAGVETVAKSMLPSVLKLIESS